MATEILRILALLVSGALIFVRAEDYYGGYGGYGTGSDGQVSGYGGEPVHEPPGYTIKKVHKIKQMSGNLLEENSDNGFKFTPSSEDFGHLCFQADAGSADNVSYNAVANCQVETSDGETLWMNLLKIKTWKKSFYVKDTTGNGNYVIYLEGGPAPEKKDSFRMFGFGRKSGKNTSKG